MTAPAHAILGASGFKKWSACSMAAAVEQGLPEEDSEYSREGTCAHGVFEWRMTQALAILLGTPEHAWIDECLVPDYEEFFNQEFSGHVQTAVDFVIERVEGLVKEHGQANVTVLLEQRLRFDRWVPEGFGTGDVVIIVPGRVIVMDYKHGAGVYVDGRDNGQIRLYALGAYERYNFLYDFEEVEGVILQPRKENISGEVVKVHGPLGLLEWAEQLVKPRAAVAWAAVQGDFSQARFSPGPHCSEAFCKARFQCAARARYMLETAEQSPALDEPHLLTIEQLEAVVDRADLVAKWAADVQRWLLSQATKGGVQLKRYKVVEGRSYRTIDDQQEAARLLMKNGFAAADIYEEPKLVGLMKLEKIVGAKKLTELLGDLLQKPAGKPTLALSSDDRQAVPPAPKGKPGAAFDDLD